MITEQQKSDLIEAVRATAEREIMPRFRNLEPGDIDVKSSAIDLVTEADRRTEDALTSASRAILPGAAVVGEEAVAEDGSLLEAIRSADRCVIIDPIDGTMNFASGIAVFGVLVAVVEGGKTVLALLYDPVLDDWAMAEPGGGAWFCRDGAAPLRLATRGERAFEETRGFIPIENTDRAERADLVRRFDRARQVHDLRCSCHEYRLLASGEADFMVSLMLNPWDHAAGQLLVTEAGGWSTLEGGRTYAPTVTEGRMITAGSQGVGQHLAAILF